MRVLSIFKLAADRVRGKDDSIKSLLAYLTLTAAVVLSSVALLTLASEFFARWYYRDILSTSSSISYLTCKSLPMFRAEFNAFGFRGEHFDALNKSDLRVAVLGDSFAWGQGVYPYTRRFSDQVKKMFQERHPGANIEIVNLGIRGHDLIQHNRFLHFIMEIDADYVLYQWYINDMEVLSRDLSKFHTPPLVPKKIHNVFSEHSVLYFLLNRMWGQVRTVAGLQISYNDYLAEKFRNGKGRHAKAARRQLNKLITRLKKNGIPVGIVLFPSFTTKMSDYPLGFLHEQVLSVCRKRNIDCLDLRQQYSVFKDKEDLWANMFDPHPSALAHDVAAKAIFQYYEQKWLQMINEKNKYN